MSYVPFRFAINWWKNWANTDASKQQVAQTETDRVWTSSFYCGFAHAHSNARDEVFELHLQKNGR